MEKFTNKEKLGLAASACGMASAFVIAWGCPEVFFGWSVPAITGMWLMMSAAMMAALASAVLLVRMAAGLHRMAIEKEIREAVQLYGREWRVSRDTVCRTAETFGRGR
jgi:hypothetical protein